MRVTAWVVRAAGQPLELHEREEAPGPGEALVRVAGCGVCHTDIGFFDGSVTPRHPLPLALGHEVSGTVAAAGPGAEAWEGREVVVPAVLPCGKCEACASDRASICGNQVFPGNHLHGGFATHLRVPAAGLCPVPDLRDPALNPAGLDLATLSVIADAVSTPYQAVVRSGLAGGDVAVFVGVGGVGGFGVQIAASLGARVIAIDVSQERLDLMSAHGALLALRADGADARELRQRVRAFAADCAVPSWRVKVFETSGTAAGQAAAFSLLGPGGYLSIVGFTPAPVSLRLSNLMAFDATVQGNWGCVPGHYPAVLQLALSGRVALRPFVEKRPMADVNQAIDDMREHRASKRIVLLPEA
ncbi:MAG TPA: 6-hydroxycyclohex-1-ene-1-carbonyl-CoA dehydrogenase [Vicinamibacteria bacterium]|nr:6-hydroxycyclohex-1-ene-1-carbonyl-CoA dehydrogenase [Vicinamibacteria bacterium]